jgi:hypothetical protein
LRVELRAGLQEFWSETETGDKSLYEESQNSKAAEGRPRSQMMRCPELGRAWGGCCWKGRQFGKKLGDERRSRRK